MIVKSNDTERKMTTIAAPPHLDDNLGAVAVDLNGEELRGPGERPARHLAADVQRPQLTSAASVC